MPTKAYHLKGLRSLGEAYDPHGTPRDFEVELVQLPEPEPLIEGNEELARALYRRPRGIKGPGWTRKDERQFESVRDSCMARKRRCKGLRTKSGAKTKCARECERVAAATVNKRRREEGRTKKKKRA